MYVCVSVVPTSYRPQFSSELDQIWIQHVFLKCLEVVFFLNFEFIPKFCPKKRFLKPKIEKIQYLYSDMPCDLSDRTSLPAQNRFKEAHLAHMNSIDRFAGVTATKKMLRTV